MLVFRSIIDTVSKVFDKNKRHKTTKPSSTILIKAPAPPINLPTLTLHIAGLRRPCGDNINTISLDNIDIEILSLSTPITHNHTVLHLSNYLHTAFSIPNTHHLLILHSHHIVSSHPKAKLSAFGIDDQSILLVAISRDPVPHPVLNEPLPTTASLQCSKGFDIIMQMPDIPVYTMPCGHEMNHESLLDYAKSKCCDRNTLAITCPHQIESKEEEEKEDKTMKYCNLSWDYASIKPIFMKCFEAKEFELDTAEYSPTTAKDKLLKDYYDNRCEYFAMKLRKELVTMTFQEQYWALKRQLKEEYNIGYKDLNNIHKRAEEKAKQDKYGQEEPMKHLGPLEIYMARNVFQHTFSSQRCFSCKTVHYKARGDGDAKEDEKNMGTEEVQCVVCEKRSFCWTCGKEWQGLHHCDALFVKEIETILQSAELKQIGPVENVPSVRCCPQCGQLIHHSEACKHMDCSRCKNKFCFVCMKPKLRDSWQCGSHGDPCPIAPSQNAKDKTLPDVRVLHANELF